MVQTEIGIREMIHDGELYYQLREKQFSLFLHVTAWNYAGRAGEIPARVLVAQLNHFQLAVVN